MSAGKRIKQERLKLGLSQRDVAAAVGISIMAISNLEREKTRNPSAENLRPIAAFLNVDPNWLITGQGRKEPMHDIRHANAVLATRSEQSETKPLTIADLLIQMNQEYEGAEPDIKEAVNGLFEAYQNDKQEGLRIAKAIKMLLGK